MKSIRLQDYIDITKPFVITEDMLPLYICVRLTEPERTGWKPIYKIENLEEDTIDYLARNLMTDIYNAVEFDPEAAIRYKMQKTWKVELSLWTDLTKKGTPSGSKVFSDKLTLYTPDSAGVVPKRMAKYLNIESEVEEKEEKKENTDLLSSLSNLSLEQLAVLSAIGGLDLNKLVENILKMKQGEVPIEKPQVIEATPRVEAEVKEDIDDVIEEIVEKESKKIIEDVSTAPTDVLTNLKQIISNGKEVLPVIRDLLKELKGLFGGGEENKKVEELTKLIKKQNQVINVLIDKVEKLEEKEKSRDELEVSIDSLQGGEQ